MAISHGCQADVLSLLDLLHLCVCKAFPNLLAELPARFARVASGMSSKEVLACGTLLGKSHLLLVFLPLLAMLRTPALSCFSFRAPFSSLNVLP